MCPQTTLAECVLDALGNVRSSASTVAGDGAPPSRRTSSTKRRMRCHPPCLPGERPPEGIIPYIKSPFCQLRTACDRIPKKKEAKKKQRERRFRSDEPGCPFSRSLAPAEYITYKRRRITGERSPRVERSKSFSAPCRGAKRNGRALQLPSIAEGLSRLWRHSVKKCVSDLFLRIATVYSS